MVRLLDRRSEGRSVGFVFENGDQCRAVDDDHTALRSSMISRGERGSKSGIAAISDPTASIPSTLMRRRGRSGSTPAGARLLFERALDRVLDGQALRGGEAFRERLGFLRELDHEVQFSTNRRRTARNNEPDTP